MGRAPKPTIAFWKVWGSDPQRKKIKKNFKKSIDKTLYILYNKDIVKERNKRKWK